MARLTEKDRLDIELAHYDLDFNNIDFEKLRDPFGRYFGVDNYIEILKIIRDPANFAFTCKYIFNVEPTIFQLVWLDQLWNYSFPMLIAGRGASKSFTEALYYALRATITQGAKIVICAPTFRQSKIVWEYIETIWNNAPVWRDLCGEGSCFQRSPDMFKAKIGRSTILSIPLGTGEQIRGLRANYVNVQEFNSINEEIFEIVLRGFTATSNNPVESIKIQARLRKLKEKGQLTRQIEDEITGAHKANQIVLSGTTGWDFQPFAKYWKRYRNIIKSGGDREKIKQIIGEYPDKGFDYRDYCIIRVPYDLLPAGMMDEKSISQAKATMDPARFNLEYGAVFSKDSNGFFPRTLIESCVCKEPILIGNNQVRFSPRMQGDSAGRYIIGIDPASEADNFAIVVLEHYPTHNRVVYCWTIRRNEFYKRYKDKDTQESNFYGFISRKIREIMNNFPVEYIALDSQGGGLQVMEALHDIKRLEKGEVPIWPLRKEDSLTYPGSKDYSYDEEAGLHIIEMVSMSNAQYVMEANHGLRKDLMNKMLLFPYADAVSLELSIMKDQKTPDEIDTLENNVLEIEELKEELSTIIHTTTLNGRDQWSTPEVIQPGGRKGRLRKDRYSALLYANAIARRLFRQSTIDYSQNAIGGFINEFKAAPETQAGAMYVGNSEFVEWANKSVLGIYVNPANIQRNDPFDYYQNRFERQ